MKISGIYKIQSRIKPHKIYIGSSVCISYRWNRHISDLRNNKHVNKKLQNHYNKYGESDLLFSVLLSCEKEDLIKIEQYFIDCYKPIFNNSPTAGSPLGTKRTKESIEKIKITLRGRGKGRKVSEETKELLRKINTGKRYSKETKKKMSEAQKRIGNKPPIATGRTPWNKGLKNPEGVIGHISKQTIQRKWE